MVLYITQRRMCLRLKQTTACIVMRTMRWCEEVELRQNSYATLARSGLRHSRNPSEMGILRIVTVKSPEVY